MAHPRLTKSGFLRPISYVLVTLALLLTVNSLIQAQGEHLLNRSLKLSDNRPGQTATYNFGFQPPSLGVIQVVELEVCANDPFPGTPCTPPSGFDASGAVLSNQTGDTGFTISPASTSNKIVLERAPFPSAGQQNGYEFTNVVNPDSDGTYYARIQTWPDSDTTGEANYFGGLAFAITNGVSVNAEVPPYLLFCVGVTVSGFDCDNVTGDYVNFGELSNRQASQGSTQMLAASNARDGYAIRVTGTTLTSGTNTIPGLTGSDISRPGVSQFGLNLRANSSPQGGQDTVGTGNGLPTNGYNQINFFRFNSGDVVAVSNAPDEARKYTSTYIVNVSSTQSPGVYVSTLTYITLGTF